MKKIILGLIMTVGVVVLGGCSLTNNNKSEIKEEINSEELTQTQKQEGGQMSLGEILGGKSQKCSWTVTDTKGNMSGIVYVDGKNFKQTIKIENQNFESYVLSDGKWLYMWSSANPKVGTKMEIPAQTDQTKGGETATSGAAIDWQKKYDYKCEGWTPTGKEFDLPVGTTFTDLSKQIEGLTNGTGFSMDEVKKKTCDFCQQIGTEAEKKSCLEESGCNQ
jgi:hypothetical protein